MLKSFFFNIYLLTFNFSFYLSSLILVVSYSLLNVDLRRKFIFFLLTILLFSIFGFLFDLDGIFLIFLTAEFTIFLIFLMAYTQLYSNYTFLRTKLKYFGVISFSITPFIYSSIPNFYYFTSYYTTLNSVVSGDFFILYYFLFDQIPFITICLILIISLFSLFFIIMYFSLKLVKMSLFTNYKYIHILRKQLMIKQTTFNNKLYTFQN